MGNQLSDQAKKVQEQLRESVDFWAFLKQESFFSDKKPAVFSEAALVDWVCDASISAADVDNFLFSIRRALDRINVSVKERKRAEEAAVGLYALIICRLVVVNEATIDRMVMDISTPVSFFCAVLAVRLAGGKLEFKGVDAHGCIIHSGVFYAALDNKRPICNEAEESEGSDVERAAYCAIFGASADAVDISEASDAAAGNKFWVNRLNSRLRTLKKKSNISVAIAFLDPPDGFDPSKFAKNRGVPILKVLEKGGENFLRMSYADLKADFQEFCEELFVASQGESPQNQTSQAGIQENAMTTNNFNFSNSNVNFSQGGNVRVGHQNLQGAQWNQVLASLQGLKAAAGGMPTSKVAEKLNARIDDAIVLADEAQTQPEKKGLLKAAVESIKDFAELAEGGEKLVGPITSLIALLAPLLGA